MDHWFQSCILWKEFTMLKWCFTLTLLHIITSFNMLLTYYLLLLCHGQLLNVHLTGYLMFTPEKDQCHSTAVQASSFEYNWLRCFLGTVLDTVNLTNSCGFMLLLKACPYQMYYFTHHIVNLQLGCRRPPLSDNEHILSLSKDTITVTFQILPKGLAGWKRRDESEIVMIISI